MIHLFNAKTEKLENDYYKDGILHCGNCNTPKEYKVQIDIPNLVLSKKVPMLCECEEQKEKQLEEKRELQRIEDWKKKRVRECLMSEANRHMTFANDDKSNPNISYVCQAYADKFEEVKAKNAGILFAGDVGTGKTFYALCIANALFDKNLDVRFTSINAEMSKLQGAYPEDRQRILDKLFNCDLLILDDIGAERNTSYAVEQIYNIIDGRYMAQKPLIATTNLTLEELENPQDVNYQRIYDRILAMCQFSIKVTGKSKRKAQARAVEEDLLNMLRLSNEKN